MLYQSNRPFKTKSGIQRMFVIERIYAEIIAEILLTQ